jgi:hypothetical protein
MGDRPARLTTRHRHEDDTVQIVWKRDGRSRYRGYSPNDTTPRRPDGLPYEWVVTRAPDGWWCVENPGQQTVGRFDSLQEAKSEVEEDDAPRFFSWFEDDKKAEVGEAVVEVKTPRPRKYRSIDDPWLTFTIL